MPCIVRPAVPALAVSLAATGARAADLPAARASGGWVVACHTTDGGDSRDAIDAVPVRSGRPLPGGAPADGRATGRRSAST